MMTFRAAAALLAAVWLGGCVTSASLLPPPDPNMATVSSRFQYHPDGGVRWQRLEILRVNGRHELNVVSTDEGNIDLKLPEGPSRLRVRATFHGWPTVPEVQGVQDSEVELSASLRKGHVYKLNGEPRGKLHFVWLEDAATGQRISDEASATYARRVTEYIFIPVRRR